MREIKFRAWASKQKIMPYSDNFLGPSWITNLYSFFHWIHELNGIKLMQYTGLHDKNGKEIYEGDIIKSQHFLPSEIIFQDGMFLACDVPLKYDTESVYPDNQWEVIGNIYENPELFEEAK